MKEKRLSKVIVITGAGSGLGRALARRFASDGDQVILFGRSMGKLKRTAAKLGERALCLECDVRSADSVRAAFAKTVEQFPAIDVLINNAAMIEYSTVIDASDEHIFDTITTNLIGTILCARAAIPLIRRGGYIINVSSGTVERHFPSLALYATSKAAVDRFSAALAAELKDRDICVTVVRASQMSTRLELKNLAAEQSSLTTTAAKLGKDPRNYPTSTYASVTNVFRAIVDLPPDVGTVSIGIYPRPIAPDTTLPAAEAADPADGEPLDE
jgi:NAD(P)-dependent dehydrogenase (short-subunit alcohol dehydrogenase family)